MARPDHHFFLGIDGGGSGCRARLVDPHGRVLGEGRAGPANLRLGVEAVASAIEAAADAAIAQALDASAVAIDPLRIHAAAGLAGTSRRDIFAALGARPHRFASLALVEDTEIACIGAHAGRDGGIVIAGTGSVGFAVVGPKRIRVGGYGFPLSDEGSGADLGLEVLRRAFRCLDGRDQPTPLLTEILARFHDDPAALIAWMDRAAATDYAKLAERIVHHAAGGDRTARELLAEAGHRIGALAATLLARGAPHLCLMGGLAPALEPHLAPHLRARLSTPDGDALSGALALAMQTPRR